jgi:hypothetical protein
MAEILADKNAAYVLGAYAIVLGGLVAYAVWLHLRLLAARRSLRAGAENR